MTSKGIQRRYWEVVKERDVRCVISDYWLLQDEECKGLIKTPLNADFPGRNTDCPERNTDFPAIKESKEKKRKGKEMPHMERFEDFWTAYPNKQRRYLAETAYCSLIRSGTATEEQLVCAATNYAAYIRGSGDRMFLPNNFLEKAIFEDYLGKEDSQTAQEKAEPEPEELIDDEEWWRYGPNAWED